ncbi:MAG: M20/M25/M40 family metallo-hydrolase, partial [Ralstonia sp.]
MSTAVTPFSTLDWTTKLVSFDTTSRGSNLALIETVRDYLRGVGLESHLSHNDDGNKANLFATIPAADGSVQGGIVLSGHTDVVPVDGQKWDSNPFAPEVRDGKLYGRGTCDMKGFIAASLALVPSLLQARLREPVHLALSYDEEVGCVGAPRMIEDLIARGIKPAGCIVGEPTSMRPIVAH